MTAIPTDFQFSQSSLQDFEICPRRFELRYLWQLRWPAIEAEPVQEAERLRRLGVDFHRLVHQHLVGLEAVTLSESLSEAEPDLKLWWQNYLDYRPVLLDRATLYPELTLSTPLGGYRLLARFDVLAVQPDGTFWLIDWKTAHHKAKRHDLERRLQTRVYPYVLAAAGTAFNNGQPLNPAAIKMMYWYPQAPDQAEIFDYSPTLFAQDEATLSAVIERIQTMVHNGDFPLTEDKQPCQQCVYRSFCDRGVEAGPMLTVEPEPVGTIEDVLALEWDQIAEIQF